MYTVGEIAKKFGISRSTLLYYDAIGVLKPSERSASNYRLYSAHDIEKMKRIVLYRDAGIPLKSITVILGKDHHDTLPILESRLFEINKEIQNLRTQQNVILKILKSEKALQHSRIFTKNQWIALLKSAGLEENNMMQFHVEFERMSPEAHQDFLESLGMREKEVQLIRKMSKTTKAKSNTVDSANADMTATDS